MFSRRVSQYAGSVILIGRVVRATSSVGWRLVKAQKVLSPLGQPVFWTQSALGHFQDVFSYHLRFLVLAGPQLIGC
jgi:hypothetical protein